MPSSPGVAHGGLEELRAHRSRAKAGSGVALGIHPLELVGVHWKNFLGVAERVGTEGAN